MAIKSPSKVGWRFRTKYNTGRASLQHIPLTAPAGGAANSISFENDALVAAHGESGAGLSFFGRGRKNCKKTVAWKL